jgi:hypothetical protein
VHLRFCLVTRIQGRHVGEMCISAIKFDSTVLVDFDSLHVVFREGRPKLSSERQKFHQHDQLAEIPAVIPVTYLRGEAPLDPGQLPRRLPRHRGRHPRRESARFQRRTARRPTIAHPTVSARPTRAPFPTGSSTASSRTASQEVELLA